VKFLIDENLSDKLAARLVADHPGQCIRNRIIRCGP